MLLVWLTVAVLMQYVHLCNQRNRVLSCGCFFDIKHVIWNIFVIGWFPMCEEYVYFVPYVPPFDLQDLVVFQLITLRFHIVIIHIIQYLFHYHVLLVFCEYWCQWVSIMDCILILLGSVQLVACACLGQTHVGMVLWLYIVWQHQLYIVW